MPNALNKGAGSEASLPLTLRVRRRAPKLLFPQDSVKNQKNRLPVWDSPLKVYSLQYPFISVSSSSSTFSAAA